MDNKEFANKYVELEVLAMDYLKELLAAQENTPKNFRDNIVDWCNGITVDHIDADSEGVYAHYRINKWDCSGSWYLDITSREGIDGKLQELECRVAQYHLRIKRNTEEHEAKERQEFERLSNKFK